MVGSGGVFPCAAAGLINDEFEQGGANAFDQAWIGYGFGEGLAGW
jgi:hypothetical protein